MPTTTINYWRQLDLFSPYIWKKPIIILGGSEIADRLAWILAKMGCGDLTVYDDTASDVRHGLGGTGDGRKNVFALADFIERSTGVRINAVPEEFEAGKILYGVVFLTDGVSNRDEIWKRSLRYKIAPELLVEIRPQENGFYLYALVPAEPAHTIVYDQLIAPILEVSVKDLKYSPALSQEIAGAAAHLVIDYAAKKLFPDFTSDPFVFGAEDWKLADISLPDDFQMPITIIGAGAVGSHVGGLLGGMNCRDITVYDDDIVEAHNIPNQIFGPEDVKKTKVQALASFLEMYNGVTINAICGKFTAGMPLRGIVFSLVDSIDTRKEIFESAMRQRAEGSGPKSLFDGRMLIDSGYGYAIDLEDPEQVKGYEQTFFSSGNAVSHACTNHAIATTVAFISGMLVRTMAKTVNKTDFTNKTTVSMSPLALTRSSF